MFEFFKRDPARKLEKQYNALLEKARDVQRAGDIKEYARLMAESETIWEQIERLRGGKA